MTEASARATKKQQELLQFVTAFIGEHDYGPSYREIMSALGYKSVSTVAVHVDGLIAKGYLERKDNSPRSLAIVARGGRESPGITELRQKLTSLDPKTHAEERAILEKALSILTT